MFRTAKWSPALSLLIALCGPVAHAGTYTAASCNESDVNAVINGPTHTAVNGDIIKIPSGTCTWTSTLSVSVSITIQGSGTPNTLPSQFGAGALNTIIKDNAGSSSPPFQVQLSYSSGAVFRISTLDIEPNSSTTALVSPIQIAGTCTASGCPQMRIDNIGFGITTPWTESGNGNGAAWLIRIDNAFGVIDHCTTPTATGSAFFDAELSSYLGVGAFGDNSWATPDTFGGANAIYAENNSLYTTTFFSDCEIAPAGGAVGGCRYVARLNHVTSSNGLGGFANHGLETNGRPQGGRQIEFYGNTANCILGSCNIPMGYRSGTGFAFGNTLTQSSGAWFNAFVSLVAFRTVFTASSGWGACGGSSPYDKNDGIVYFTGTNSGTTGSTTLTDNTKNFGNLIPIGAPFSVHDISKGWWAEIASNTATTLTIQPSIPEQTNTFNNGDSYEILRATVCANQPGRGAGNLVSGTPPAPASALSQALDPIYEWNDTASLLGLGVNISTDTGRTIANRDWYTDNSLGTPHVQTSPTSPFNGSGSGGIGVGFGTLANRPTTCTPRVGYWATDQGNWNQSGSGGQGQLYVCTATNTWTLYYTPYTYPHPLIAGGTTGTTVNPPTSLAATVQ